MYSIPWLTALVMLCSLSVDAWSLGRIATSRRALSVFPRRYYRQLDHDEERANPTLRTFWRSFPSIAPQNSAVSLVEDAWRPSGRRITAPRLGGSTVESSKQSNKNRRPIANVQDLRKAVLDDGLELRQTQLVHEAATLTVKELLNHQVIQLIAERAKSGSTPGHRHDNATLALSMEGGGMRGAVSAGMAAAIASLGLCDVFDAVYGSSAGSVVGAFFVSRQMCVDVYTQVLPAAQRKFVCKKRMVAGLMASAVDLMLGSAYASNRMGTPGMNISFVLDGIMDHRTWLAAARYGIIS